MGKKKRNKTRRQEDPPTCPKCGKKMTSTGGRPTVSLFYKWQCECGHFEGYGAIVGKPVQ